MVGWMLGVLVLAAKPVTIHVSVTGNDAWSGRLASANASRTDGPVASLIAARDTVRRVDASTPATVRLQPGVYQLTAPLRLGPEDSGTATAPREWVASAPGKVIVDGSRRISGWKTLPDGSWVAPWATLDAGLLAADQLFVNGRRALRPRFPADGYARVVDRIPPTDPAQGFDGFKFAENAVRAAYRNPEDVEVIAFHNWTMSRNRIRAVDPAAKTVRFRRPAAAAAYLGDYVPGGRYLVENVYEAFGRPGEWYRDRSAGVIRYTPRAGETLANTEFRIPLTETLLKVSGTPERPVHHLAFRGLTFARTGWALGPEGHMFYQAEIDQPGTVGFFGVRDITIDRCTVTQTGGYGLEVGADAQRVNVSRSVFSDLGAGGIRIGPTDVNAIPTKYVTVSDCDVVGYGRIHAGGIAVWIGQAAYNTVRGCILADGTYSAVSCGWTWGYGPSAAHHNVIEGNRMSQIGQGVLSDMGAVYLLGTQPGTVVRGNVIYDVDAEHYGGWGLYTDEGSSGVVLEDNLVFRTKHAGFHQHYGKDNIVRNNVFAYGVSAQLQRTRAEAHRSFTFEGNIVFWDRGPTLNGNWSDTGFQTQRNVYWRTDGEPIKFQDQDWATWQGRGLDAESMIADPRFRRPEAGDFRLAPTSPALKMGFRPFPFLDPGRRPRRPLPEVPRAWPVVRP